MESTLNYNKKEFHVFVANIFPNLVKFREEKDKTSFNELLIKVLPEVKRYVTKRLNTAISKGNIPRGKYKTDDFVDQLFIEVYEHLEEVENKKDFHSWLFKKADELLEERMVEEEFDSLFFENIDDYSKAEWDDMAEKYTMDGDGDLIMVDELDDISYRKHDYISKNIFLDDANKNLMAKLDKDLGKENILKHTEMVLHHLSPSTRAVFDLFTEQHFDLKEIATIRNHTVQEVEALLEEARKSLESSFYNRYIKNM
ncbi:RNA polymerase sigma factor (sigma-70 family) [Saonia flava]|uniref:RNA polymerase sigma factor (Sigma-70 family) n=1 Tax=Saonia flava TaxID=523696 RepID=A0A846QVR6_9FLAO|nr:sigma-70 family RNA polymerase sigma factor [Saonia flava]NJB70383.1 RNA polymerase sigma factor (sigma-70 family) [Saonia flava]